MPVAQNFKAQGAANGFPTCNIFEFDCTIGNQFKSLDPASIPGVGSIEKPIVQDYITLGGYKGSDGGGPTDKQIEDSRINAMKIFWNWNGLNVNVGGSADASSDITSVKTFTYTLNRGSTDPDNPEGSPTNYTLTTNTSSSKSISNSSIIGSSNLIHTSNEPKERLTTDPTTTSTIPFIEEIRETSSESDSATDSFSGTIYGRDQEGNLNSFPFTENFSHNIHAKGTRLAFGGLGTTFETENGELFSNVFDFRAGGKFGFKHMNNIIKLFDNGNFVGYGILSFFTSARFQALARADGNGGTIAPLTSTAVDCLFDLSSIFLQDETMEDGFTPLIMNKSETVISGIPTFLIVGRYASTISDETLNLTFPTSNKAKFTGTGITRTEEEDVNSFADDGNITNLIVTDTVTHSCSFELTFEVLNLDLWTYPS